MLRALRRDGWHVVGASGSHQQMTHPTKSGRVTVPMHAGRTLEPNVTASILRQAGLTPDDFRGLL